MEAVLNGRVRTEQDKARSGWRKLVGFFGNAKVMESIYRISSGYPECDKDRLARVLSEAQAQAKGGQTGLFI